MQDVAFAAGLVAAMLRCLFGALSGHRLSSQARNLARSGNQALGQVEQAAEARLDEARPEGQRAGEDHESRSGF